MNYTHEDVQKSTTLLLNGGFIKDDGRGSVRATTTGKRLLLRVVAQRPQTDNEVAMFIFALHHKLIEVGKSN